MKHLENYESERKWVLMLSDFLEKNVDEMSWW